MEGGPPFVVFARTGVCGTVESERRLVCSVDGVGAYTGWAGSALGDDLSAAAVAEGDPPVVAVGPSTRLGWFGGEGGRGGVVGLDVELAQKPCENDGGPRGDPILGECGCVAAPPGEVAQGKGNVLRAPGRVCGGEPGEGRPEAPWLLVT